MEPCSPTISHRMTLARFVLILAAVWPFSDAPAAASGDVFARLDLPEAWQNTFWASENARAVLKLDLKAVAELVPNQAGVRHCRCPGCDATGAEDTLNWSIAEPKKLTCGQCKVVVPNEKIPAHEEKKPVPEDTVEVLPGVVHKYPYHEVEADKARYPDERLYLSAKVDDRAREFLAKTALYAAARYRKQPSGKKDAAVANLSATILVRFARVYPAYALHYDQPNSAKFFEQADLPPPYRSGYRTGKWEWTGSQNVPLNLVVAYGLLKDDPAIDEAGRRLGVADPRHAIEHDLFLASADFVRKQPEEFSEASLRGYRGILAVGKLLNDPSLMRDGMGRLEEFTRRGFYYDGFWRQGGLAAHRRVLGQIDGWIDRLLLDERVGAPVASERGLPMLGLARAAESAVLSEAPEREVLQATWPASTHKEKGRAPALLGGVGLARLALGQGEDALDIELRGLASFGPATQQRQTLRVAVGNQIALGDLDDLPPLPSGFNRATASHNTVTVDGLNQGESINAANEPVAGGNFLFFAADPDFQVVSLEDPHAYPQSATRYRQTIAASAGVRSRYSVAVFEVQGGLQHDQFFHAPAGIPARWRLSVPVNPWPGTLLPPGLTFVPTARSGDGRWFVQSYGEFQPLDRAELVRPTQAWLSTADNVPGGVKLHVLGEVPLTAITATGPDPTEREENGQGRASLILRRRSTDGSTLKTRFVTLIEPIANAIPPLVRVGRGTTTPGAVVVYVETAEGTEQLIFNGTPGTEVNVTLADGRVLKTDGLVARLNASGLVLAGGTFAECGSWKVGQRSISGHVTGVARKPEGSSRGYFETDAPIPEPDSLAGRTVLVRHGDGATHGWTIHRVVNDRNSARIWVREEPGFEIDPASGAARFYQFPRAVFRGPHTFRVSRLAR